MKGSGIYKIYSISKPDRVYVGSSMVMRKRMQQHFASLKKNTHRNSKLQNHYNKYGKDDLVFVVIEPCFPEFLLIREQYYIDLYKPYFNIRPVANSTFGLFKGELNPFYGKKHTEETREKMRIARALQVYTEEHRQGISKGNKGKTINAATREKIRQAKKGVKLTDQHKKSLSGNHADFKGEKHPFFGKKHSEETRKKLKETRRNQIITEDARKKISEALKGRKHSEESIKKMSDARKAYYAEKRLAQQN